MTLERLTKITSVGISSGIQLSDPVFVGVVTATKFNTENINATGVSTLGNTVVGGGTTQLIVTGNARITGILTIGTSSVTLDGTNNQVNVGTGVTIHHTNGVQVGGNTVHSTGLTINQINVGTGASISSPATNVLTLGTNNLERVRIDSNGRLGIGTDNPTTKLDVFVTGGEGLPSVVTGERVRIISNDVVGRSGFLSIIAGSSAYSGVFFGDKDAADIGKIRYYHADNSLQFLVNGTTEAIRVTSAGNVGIGTANPDVLLDVFKTSYPEINLKTGTVTATFGVDTGNNTFVVGSTTNHPFTLRTNGTDRLYLTSGGNVGIGITNSTAKLTISQTGGQNFINLYDSANLKTANIIFDNDYLIYKTGGSEKIRITDTGNIGINTTIFPANGKNIKIADSTISRILLDKTGSSARSFSIGNGGTYLNVYDETAEAERLRIDSSGGVTMPYQPSFAARLTTDQTNITGAGTYYTLICNTTTGTTSHNVGSHYSTSTGVFTVPVTGYYYFEGAVTLSTNVYGRAGEFWLSYNNDSIRWFLDRRYFTSVSGTITHMGGSVMIRAVAGDNLRIRGFISGGSQDVSILSSGESSTVSHFAGRLLG